MDLIEQIKADLERATPGPWVYAGEYGYWDLRGADRHDIAHYTTDDDGIHIDNAADAQLITSAPAMAEALLAADRVIQKLEGSLMSVGVPEALLRQEEVITAYHKAIGRE